MAPEQLAGLDVGPAADQFAFCVALWEALYGERPFRGDGVFDLVRAITEGDRATPPRGTRVPRWLHRACERGLAADPAQRFADMHALVSTLQSGHRRMRIRVAAIGLGAVALVGVGVVVGCQHARAQAIAACERDGAAIAEIWNDGARAAVGASLLRSGATGAETTVEKVTPWLDEHAHAWARARTDACQAHALQGRWDDDMLDRSAWCLDERRLELQALVTTLADADAEAANRAVVAAAGLHRIEPCLDDATLHRRSAPPPETRAEIAEIHAEVARADALRATGAYHEGLAVAQASLARAKRLGWPRLTSAARLSVGSLLERTGAYAEAETSKEAAYFEALGAGEIEQALDAADGLADLVGTTRARPDEGMRWAKHAAILRAALPDPLGLREAWELDNVARIEFARGDYEAAQTGYEAALERVQGALGPEHPIVATGLDSLGLARFRRGDYAQARADFERALAIVETTKGREHRDVVTSLNNLALVEIKTGAYAEARAHLERALALWTAALGPTHPKVAIVVSNLGAVAHFLGEYEKATSLHARALEIREKALGPEHPDVAESLNNLGFAHSMMGHDDDAKPLYERALAIKTSALGPDHPGVATTLVGLGSVLQRQGDDDAAESLFVRALAILEPALGPEHPDVSEPLVGLARVAIDRGRGPEAVAFAERALALREHGDVPAEERAAARLVMARALLVVDAHSARAQTLAEQACATIRRGGPAMRPDLAECEAFAHD